MTQNFRDLDADTIIVGGGLSGLSAAFNIIKRNPAITILLLEASEEFGGRKLINSTTEDTIPQWVSSQQKLLLQLLKQLDIEVVQHQTPNRTVLIEYDNKLYINRIENAFGFSSVAAKLELTAFINKLENICKINIAKVKDSVKSQSMHDFIVANLMHQVNRDIFEFTVLITFGVTATELTVEFYIFFSISTHGVVNQLLTNPQGLREYRIQESVCNKLATHLKDDVNFLSKTKVLSIKTYRYNVEVITDNGTFYSNNVILAMSPPAVTKINFTPSLLNELTLKSARMGTLGMFVVTYDKPIWELTKTPADIYVLNNYNSKNPLLCCFDISTENKSVLFGYTNNVNSDTQILILQQLSRYFGSKALQPVDIQVKDRNGEGSPMYCYPTCKHFIEAKAKQRRLLFAGSECSIEWYGTLSGALCSGELTAQDLLYDLTPTALTVNDLHQSTIDSFDKEFESALKQIKTERQDNNYVAILNRRNQIKTVIIAIILIQIWCRRNAIKETFQKFLSYFIKPFKINN